MELNDYMNENYEVLITKYIDSQDQNTDQQIINAILLQFQVNNSSRNQIRRKAIQLVFEIFTKYNSLTFFGTDFIPLFQYFSKQFYDVNMIDFAIKIFQNLLQKYENLKNLKEKPSNQNLKNFKNPENDEIIFDFFFSALKDEKIEIGQYSQKVRYQFYSLTFFYCKNYPNLVLQKNEDFVKNVIIMIEDEKDPRNIVLSFQLTDFILKHFSPQILEPRIQEIFDNLECYFPIEINQKSSDQNSKNIIEQVEENQVQEILENCLISEYLVKTTIGMLVEKISSETDESVTASFNCFIKIFQKYSHRFFTNKELQNIQKNITIMNYDVNNKSLSQAHIQSLINFQQFMMTDKQNGIILYKNSQILDKMFHFYLDIVIEESSSEDSRKALHILQELSQNNIYANNYLMSFYSKKIFLVKFELNNSEEDCLFWLENLLLFLQGSDILNQQNKPLQKYSYNISLNTQKNIKRKLNEAFNMSNSQFIKVLSLKLLMMFKTQNLKSEDTYDILILDQINLFFEKNYQLQSFCDDQFNKCLIDFGQSIDQKIIEEQKSYSQISKFQQFCLEKLEQFYEQQKKLSEGQTISEQEFQLEISLISYILVKSLINCKNNENLLQKVLEFLISNFPNKNLADQNLVLVQKMSAELFTKNLDYQQKNQVLKILNLLILEKKLPLGYNSDIAKQMSKIYFSLLENPFCEQDLKLQVQNFLQKNLLEVQDPENIKLYNFSYFIKTLKYCQKIFGDDFKNQFVNLLQKLYLLNQAKNKQYLTKLSLFYGNNLEDFYEDFQKYNLEIKLNQCNNFSIQTQIFLGALIKNSQNCLKIMQDLSQTCLNINEQNTQQLYDFFTILFKQIQKRRKYLTYTVTLNQQIFCTIFYRLRLKQDHVNVINYFYPQGNQLYKKSSEDFKEISNSSSSPKKSMKLKKIESEPLEVNYSQLFYKKVQLLTIVNTPFNIVSKKKHLILPFIIDYINKLNQQQPEQIKLIIKVLHKFLQINLKLFESHYRSLISGLLQVLKNEEIQNELETILQTLLCLVECLNVPYPIFVEFQENINEQLEILLEHKKRLVRQYAVYMKNQIFTLQTN